ncbi:MAG TPA: hypothetical protein VF981_07950 [Gemmatimonadaceae bacterium]
MRELPLVAWIADEVIDELPAFGEATAEPSDKALEAGIIEPTERLC